ncbi:SulP family inorganic anion transporter [Pseudarthrobacter sp. BIM B-2242]|uniref:SulP family inorganic anion transporter n=1 Tax=Pseudarthrobacter sp. BIM B-2242 TaxID=2772401 RepID=UPI00168AAF0D|nr:SulP family inorganic anion transporter [Pseudarthrobacter sp. BIM B-2242]QOD02488.1 SulP family inorganic anion transporter [Pseudarthrobacter sp. BIM B-2242]
MSTGLRSGSLALSRFLPSRADYAGLRLSWRTDVFAGITVGIVALPLALAFGVSSGVGAEAGLITAIVAGLVAAVMGGSHVQVSGPTGAMVVVLAPVVAVHGTGSVALVSLMAGLMVCALGISGLGKAVAFIPWPVVEGFTLGIAAIIFLQQVPLATGTAGTPGHNTLLAAIEAASVAVAPTVVLTLALVAGVAVVMILVQKYFRALPASLLAVLLATAAAELLRLDVPRIGELPHSLPSPSVPAMDLASVSALAMPAVAIAALAAIESLLSARVAGGMAGPDGTPSGPYSPDRELTGQGLASIAAGLFGGMPATGAIARTAVNVRSGAKTRLSAVVHAVVLLAIVYLAAGLVGRIPLAALGGVLMVTAARMVSRRTVTAILRSTRSDAAVFILTAIITVAFDLIVAIQIGLAAAALFTLRKFASLSSVQREEIAGPAADGDEHIAVFRLDGAMFFGAAERILQGISQVRDVQVAIIRLSQVRMLDATGAHALVEVISALELRGITVLLKGVRPDHLALVTNVGVIRSLRHHKHLFEDLPAAVEHARSHVRRNAAAATA